ncbi:MAG TPA: hypothetical protein VM511_08055 [Luteolibacter sp.]|jgi:hypothetical protein|nr:hypothetical protein [Luteolibacter sp.]
MAAKKAAKKATSTDKAPAKKAAKKTAVKKTAQKAPKVEKKPAPSLEAVARGAYLNYRRRVENGLPGDSHGDWLEAERQLREEV